MIPKWLELTYMPHLTFTKTMPVFFFPSWVSILVFVFLVAVWNTLLILITYLFVFINFLVFVFSQLFFTILDFLLKYSDSFYYFAVVFMVNLCFRICPCSVSGTSGCSQQYRAWPDCMDVCINLGLWCSKSWPGSVLRANPFCNWHHHYKGLSCPVLVGDLL